MLQMPPQPQCHMLLLPTQCCRCCCSHSVTDAACTTLLHAVVACMVLPHAQCCMLLMHLQNRRCPSICHNDQCILECSLLCSHVDLKDSASQSVTNGTHLVDVTTCCNGKTLAASGGHANLSSFIVSVITVSSLESAIMRCRS